MRAPFVIGMAAVAALVAAAIILPIWWFVLRGDDSVSAEVETYFQDVETLINNIERRSLAVEVPAGEPGQGFLRNAVILGDTAGDLRALAPPARVASAHEELAAAVDAGTEALSALYDEHGDIATLAEYEQLLNEDEALAEAGAQMTEACTTLRDAAQEMGVDVYFSLCPRAGETAPTAEATPTAESIDDLTEPTE